MGILETLLDQLRLTFLDALETTSGSSVVNFWTILISFVFLIRKLKVVPWISNMNKYYSNAQASVQTVEKLNKKLNEYQRKIIDLEEIEYNSKKTIAKLEKENITISSTAFAEKKKFQDKLQEKYTYIAKLEEQVKNKI